MLLSLAGAVLCSCSLVAERTWYASPDTASPADAALEATVPDESPGPDAPAPDGVADDALDAGAPDAEPPLDAAPEAQPDDVMDAGPEGGGADASLEVTVRDAFTDLVHLDVMRELAVSDASCSGGPPCGMACTTPFTPLGSGTYDISSCTGAPRATFTCGSSAHTGPTLYFSLDVPALGGVVVWPSEHAVVTLSSPCGTSGACCADASCWGRSLALLAGHYDFAVLRLDGACGTTEVSVFYR